MDNSVETDEQGTEYDYYDLSFYDLTVTVRYAMGYTHTFLYSNGYYNGSELFLSDNQSVSLTYFDLNGDGCVNTGDTAVFYHEYSETVPDKSESNDMACLDINHDGIINKTDGFYARGLFGNGTD